MLDRIGNRAAIAVCDPTDLRNANLPSLVVNPDAVVDVIRGIGLRVAFLGFKLGKSHLPAGLEPFKKVLVGGKQVAVLSLQSLSVHFFKKRILLLVLRGSLVFMTIKDVFIVL